MPVSPQSLQVEKFLAIAHQALWRAAVAAESLREQGLCDDLYQLAGEVGALNLALLHDERRRRKPRS